MASIDFGTVENFIEDKGFGFVSRTFSSGGHIFFHIKTIKRFSSKLAQELNSYDPYAAPYFWYEFEKTQKGAQVVALVNPTIIAEQYADEFARIADSINKVWMDENQFVNIYGNFPPLPESVAKATIDIIPAQDLILLKEKRVALEKEKNRVKVAEKEEMRAQRDARVKIEEEEFAQLLNEISNLGFTHSKQVSEYIVRNQLGYKYKNISGILRMGMRGDIWDFNGGFPTNVYARLCDELGLENQGSQAKPLGFRSYKNLFGE